MTSAYATPNASENARLPRKTEPPKRHQLRYDHRYELQYRGASVGVVKTYNTGEIEVRLTGFTAELQERFAQRLSEVMQEFEQ